MLSENNGNLRPLPYDQGVPPYDQQKRGGRRRKSYCPIICCCGCCCCLFIILFVIAVIFIYFFILYRPRMPLYDLQGLEVQAFDIKPNSTLVELLANAEAQNPNQAIWLDYSGANSATLSYKETTICNGSFQAFKQGQETTIIQIPLKANGAISPELQKSLMQDKNSSRIPLTMEAKMPIGVVLFERYPVKAIAIDVHVFMVVDNLSPHKKINIVSKNVYTTMRVWNYDLRDRVFDYLGLEKPSFSNIKLD
ncbi:hypothetical protein NMG60_11035560 [Bertholletia excelsa]